MHQASFILKKFSKSLIQIKHLTRQKMKDVVKYITTIKEVQSFMLKNETLN